MKKIKTKYMVVTLMFGLTFGLYNCTRHDQTLNVAPASGTLLTSVKTATPPSFVSGYYSGGSAWGGPSASLWKNAPVLNITATVPDVEGSSGANGFNGFIGNSTPMTLQSMYDANYIYFLITWKAAQANRASSPWFFNPATKLWAQGGAAPTYNVDGEETMQSICSDEIVMLFNINNSCADFTSQSCYGACHTNVGSMVLDTLTGAITSTTTNCMHTNAVNEKLDCWRARFYEVEQTGQALDYYQDYDGGVLGGSGIHADQSVPNGSSPPSYSSNASTNGAGSVSNKQTLTITGTSKHESVPLWVKANDNYPYAQLLPSDTLGAALKEIAVDSNGVLTLQGGSTINPNNGTTYQQVGTGIGNNDQTTWIPGKIVFPYTGGEGDVTANAMWSGSGWTMMLKRALKTTDVLEQDVDFSSLANQQFGIGVMFQANGSINAADNEHAIMPGLTLTFQK